MALDDRFEQDLDIFHSHTVVFKANKGSMGPKKRVILHKK